VLTPDERLSEGCKGDGKTTSWHVAIKSTQRLVKRSTPRFLLCLFVLVEGKKIIVILAHVWLMQE